MKSHLISFIIGAIGGYLLMITNPLGSTNPRDFGFYWAIVLSMFVSFSTAWGVKKLQKKPEE
nr:hypothetical protein [Cytophagales bacterium]